MGDQNSQQFSPRTIPQPDAPDVEKKGDVYAAESELQKACVEIENDADQLLDQLSPILRPDRPTVADSSTRQRRRGGGTRPVRPRPVRTGGSHQAQRRADQSA